MKTYCVGTAPCTNHRLHFEMNLSNSNVVGNLYPAYASYKALTTPGNAHAIRQWLMYWVVCTMFWLFELLGDAFISWLPLYYEAKMVFIFWLVLPSFQGASVLYEKFVEPAFNQHEPVIDEVLNRGSAVMSQHISHVRSWSGDALRRGSAEVLRLAVNAQLPPQQPAASPAAPSPNNAPAAATASAGYGSHK